ncbi:hypothetical protein L526_3887 [Bordetella bronchiseptica MBORD785]|nr:hypothetical protein L516_3682 [Bordetella bronchiseptica MBORD668]KDD22468.1 hypothetical protein L526_3887 [Bordetella bronchiseptica MBORD785]
MFFEVTGQFVDASGKQCHLNFRGAGIALSALELRDDFGFFDVSYRHLMTSTDMRQGRGARTWVSRKTSPETTGRPVTLLPPRRIHS